MASPDASPAAGSDLGHRRLLDFAPCPGPVEGRTLFDRIGGQATVDRLVDSLYARFETDAVIRPFFGRDLSNGRTKQQRFLAEWLGGPPAYSESAWGALYSHHEDLPITQPVAERWVGHLRDALRDAVHETGDAEIILERATVIADALVNHQASAPAAGRASGGSLHRSERVASCGVGARTLKGALQSAQRGKVETLATLVAGVPEIVERAALAAGVLQAATLAGRSEIVEWLLDRGVDVNGPAPLPVNLIGAAFELVFYVTPLCAAHMRGRAEISALLCERGARHDIFSAAFLGDLPLVRQLLAETPSLSQVSDPATDVVTITPIHHAVGGDQLPTLRVLLDHATEPVRTGARALRAAAARGNRAMVDLLLVHGADGHALGPGRWVLDPEMAPRLAATGASAGVGTAGEVSGDWVRISCTGNRGRQDDPAYVTALLRYGARVDDHYNGATPLHYAAKAGFVRTIRVLLDHGADPDGLDDRGRRPIDWLAQAVGSVDRTAVVDALSRGPRPRT